MIEKESDDIMILGWQMCHYFPYCNSDCFSLDYVTNNGME
jgi:hypothetical protein